MKTNVLSVLLCLLCALVEVNSQTFPFLSFMGTDLPNHTYVDYNLVRKVRNTGVECHSDLRGCCFDAETHNADWYFPNGERLHADSRIFDIFEVYRIKNIQVRRNNSAETGGIYRCEIETRASNNGSRETLYAGLYSSGGICICVPSLYVLCNSLMQYVAVTHILMHSFCKVG